MVIKSTGITENATVTITATPGDELYDTARAYNDTKPRTKDVVKPFMDAMLSLPEVLYAIGGFRSMKIKTTAADDNAIIVTVTNAM